MRVPGLRAMLLFLRPCAAPRWSRVWPKSGQNTNGLALIYLFEHEPSGSNPRACFFRKPASTFRDHALQRCDRADLDQKLLAHQAVDDQQRVRRVDLGGKQLGELARPPR